MTLPLSIAALIVDPAVCVFDVIAMEAESDDVSYCLAKIFVSFKETSENGTKKPSAKPGNRVPRVESLKLLGSLLRGLATLGVDALEVRPAIVGIQIVRQGE